VRRGSDTLIKRASCRRPTLRSRSQGRVHGA
jgi:hypothetical protein